MGKYYKRVSDGWASGALGFQESYELIVSLLSMYSQTTIIIDALDESNPKERWQLLDVLEKLAQSSATIIKIFISSRDDVDIMRRFEGIPNLYISASDNSEDIERFVHREVTQAILKKTLLCGYVTEELKQQIISAILSKANGM